MFKSIQMRLLDKYKIVYSTFLECRVKNILLRNQSTDNVIRSPYDDVCLPDMPLHHYVWRHVHKWSNHIAVECGVSGRKYSYNQLFIKSKSFASSLRKYGLKRGETFGIVLPNTPDFPIAYLGALESGLIPTTFNPNYTKDEMVYQLNDCGSKWVVCHPINLQVMLDAKKLLNRSLNIICTQNLDGTSPQCDGIISFEESLNNSSELNDFDENTFDNSNTTLIAYSSGTTGRPKGTCLTHKSLTANIEQMTQPEIVKILETTGDHQDIIPAVLPFFHLYGNVIILLQALCRGAKVITLPHFDPKLYLKLLEANSNILNFVVPPIVFFLGNHEDVKEKHLRGTRELMSAAAPCSQQDIEKIKAKSTSNIRFTQGYGLTETSPMLTIHTPANPRDNNYATVGKVVPNTLSKIVDVESGAALPSNTTGELVFKGPQLMKCYLNNPEATSEMIDSNGWLHTGDVGYYDGEGNFYITDRMKELIKVKGYQVAPAELEYVIRGHPSVLEAGVVGVPCDRTGETPVAFVQTIPGAKVSEEDIKTFIASKLSKHKHLSSVKFIQAIPKTPSGKILRKELKKLAVS